MLRIPDKFQIESETDLQFKSRPTRMDELRIEPVAETAILFAPCASRCSIYVNNIIL